jgi:hypothetical protein
VAAAFGPEGRLRFAPKIGLKSEVSFTNEELAYFKGATVKHNHPGGSCLSSADLYMASAHDMDAIRAVGKFGGFKGDPHGYNGYITWPKMGFKGELTPEFKAMLSSKLGDNETHDIHGLIDKYGEKGMNAWADHGSTFRGTFDLKPGSVCMNRLNAYRVKKGIS